MEQGTAANAIVVLSVGIVSELDRSRPIASEWQEESRPMDGENGRLQLILPFSTCYHLQLHSAITILLSM